MLFWESKESLRLSNDWMTSSDSALMTILFTGHLRLMFDSCLMRATVSDISRTRFMPSSSFGSIHLGSKVGHDTMCTLSGLPVRLSCMTSVMCGAIGAIRV